MTNPTTRPANKVVTPEFRASFAYVFSPQPPMEGSTSPARYSITMLFDEKARKSPNFKAMQTLAVNTLKEKFGGSELVPDGRGWFRGYKSPFRSGEEKPELEGYGKNVVFAAATSMRQPGVIDAGKARLISEEDFYSGCYARATVTAYAYNKSGNKGVAFGLQNLQKLAEGEALAGRTAPEDDFEAVDDFVAAGDADMFN